MSIDTQSPPPTTHVPRVAVVRDSKSALLTKPHGGSGNSVRREKSVALADGHHPRELVNATLAPLNRWGDELGPRYRVVRYNPANGTLILIQIGASLPNEHTVSASVVYDWFAVRSVHISIGA